MGFDSTSLGGADFKVSKVPPTNRGVLWIDNTIETNQKIKRYDENLGEWIEVSANSFGYIDKAETFGESGLTLTGNYVKNGNQLEAQTSFSANTTLTSNLSGGTNSATESGYEMIFNSDTAYTNIDIKFTTNTIFGAKGNNFVLKDNSGNTVQTTSSSNKTFSNVDINANEDYVIGLTGNMNVQTEPTASLPTSANGWTIKSQTTGGGGAYFFEDLKFDTSTGFGSVNVEFTYPTNIFNWDEVIYRGSDITVDIQEYDGSSWNTIASDVGVGDNIVADPSNNVRFNVTFDTASAKLTKLYRRRKV